MGRLKIFVVLGLGLLGGAIGVKGQVQRYTFEHPQMGTLFRIVLYHDDSLQARIAAESAWRRIDRLNDQMSDYFAESELNALSATSGKDTCIQVSPALWDILNLSRKMYEHSQERFDITIGPLVQLWRRARRKGMLPDSLTLETARESVSSTYLHFKPADSCVLLEKPGMRLDLGGIAKGYAVDQALGVLNTFGITRALVDGGGDLVLGDPPPDSVGWRVELKVLGNDGLPRDTVLFLAQIAIASSGDTYRYLEIEGTKYSHILDPQPGIGLTQRRRVSVIAAKGVWADAWASALSVMGPEVGLHRLASFPGVSALILEVEGEKVAQYVSDSFFSHALVP